MMIRLLLATAMIATPVAAMAQDDGAPPNRIRSVTLQPGEKCPPKTGDEVVVCTTLLPQEQYRIPKELRAEPKTTPDSTSWAVKADRAMQDNRRVLPGSCSPIGSNGHTGCAQAAAEAWSAEKRAAANGQSVTPND